MSSRTVLILHARSKWGRKMPILWIAMAAGPATLPERIIVPPPPAVEAAPPLLPQPGVSGPTPRGNPGSWVTTPDYPSSELAQRVEGITAFRLAVDKEGGVADCMVTQSSGSTVLDATACALIKARAQFTPGRNEKGQTVAGFYSNRVRWVLPPVAYQPLPEGKWDVTTTVFVSETGFIESCDFASACNDIANGAKGFTPCTPYVRGRFLRAHKNSAGKPIRYHVIFHQTTDVVPD